MRFGLPIISDEVFRDYQLNPAPDSVLTLQDCERCAGLHFERSFEDGRTAADETGVDDRQWSGGAVREALERLEMIADTYLSVGTPVQCALPSLLELRGPVQRQILDRLRGNLAVLAGIRFAHARRRSGMVRDRAADRGCGNAAAAGARRSGAAGIFLRFRKPGSTSC